MGFGRIIALDALKEVARYSFLVTGAANGKQSEISMDWRKTRKQNNKKRETRNEKRKTRNEKRVTQ